MLETAINSVIDSNTKPLPASTKMQGYNEAELIKDGDLERNSVRSLVFATVSASTNTHRADVLVTTDQVFQEFESHQEEEKKEDNDVCEQDKDSNGNESIQRKKANNDSQKSSPMINSHSSKVPKYRNEPMMKKVENELEVITRFNDISSTEGLEYAAKCGFIDIQSPKDVASYLLRNKTFLDKAKIGEYLGRKDMFSVEVLREYVGLLEFTSMSIDDAIRHYFDGFRIPGEAQQIDRIMEMFAERYTLQNHVAFPYSANAAHTLAFSIIMLNTDVHNTAIKESRKMSKTSFIRNVQGISEDCKDLPEDLLSSIFDRVKSKPISTALGVYNTKNGLLFGLQKEQRKQTSHIIDALALSSRGAERLSSSSRRLAKQASGAIAATSTTMLSMPAKRFGSFINENICSPSRSLAAEYVSSLK